MEPERGVLDPVRGAEELEEAFRLPRALIFKHSTACGGSHAAAREVERFLAARPGAPVFVVHVIEQRPLSNELAERTGIRHTSPQVILLEDGKPVWSASHFAITAEALAERLAPSEAPAR